MGPCFRRDDVGGFIFKSQRQTHVRDLAARSTRVVAFISRPTEGVGNAGCPLHPQPRVQCVGGTRVSPPQVHRDHPAFPHAMVLTASFVLSPVTGLLCHRRLRIPRVKTRSGRHASANLTPASGRQDHTTSPSAASSLVSVLLIAHGFREPALQSPRAQNAAASTASRPAFVTIAIRPSCGVGRCRLIEMFLPSGKANFFSQEDYTAKSPNGPSGKSP